MFRSRSNFFGGKGYLAKKIVPMFSRHLHYVEAYAGGLACLLERDPNDTSLWLPPHKGVSEVVNDLHKDLTNFWRVLQGGQSFAAFKRLCDATPLNRMEWQDAEIEFAEMPEPVEACSDAVTRAWKFFIYARQSRAGMFKDFTSLTRNRLRRGINGNASEWLSAVENLPAVHARLRPVVVENMNALDLIRREDEPTTFFYLDPPYMTETRTVGEYAYEVDEAHHRKLLEILANLKGKFMLSGYACPLYDSFETACKWRCLKFDLPNNAAGGKSKRRMTENVWCNYAVEEPAP